MPIAKDCVICGASFTVPPTRRNTAKTCSLECRGKFIANGYAAKRTTLVCPACKKPFSVPPAQRDVRTFCSDECADPFRKPRVQRGSKHYAWAGGTAKHSEGYLYRSMPGHPFGHTAATYVFAHRVVVEEAMRALAPEHPFLVSIDGRKYLRPEIEVHHINGIKQDNRPANLLACTIPAHRAIHNGGAPMVGEVWPEILGLEPYQPRIVICTCKRCGKEFRKQRSDVKRGSGVFCSRDCYNRRERVPYKISLS